MRWLLVSALVLCGCREESAAVTLDFGAVELGGHASARAPFFNPTETTATLVSVRLREGDAVSIPGLLEAPSAAFHLDEGLSASTTISPNGVLELHATFDPPAVPEERLWRAVLELHSVWPTKTGRRWSPSRGQRCRSPAGARSRSISGA